MSKVLALSDDTYQQLTNLAPAPAVDRGGDACLCLAAYVAQMLSKERNLFRTGVLTAGVYASNWLQVLHIGLSAGTDGSLRAIHV